MSDILPATCSHAEKEGMRLDQWLWYARLQPTRTMAQKLCRSKRLRADGEIVNRANKIIHPGTILSYPWGGHIVAIRVEALAGHRRPYKDARLLYTELLDAPGLLLH